ncbi:MAG: hypothetical protein KGJ79_05480 [Alphaproteobacteria bacterium]|nr:hypothetical protein [Alphaproteobacteria bacterium]MDE2110572.1 hypothetical protein [Alphaproteobacteria bacterium]MDE2492700.1 hypothetical protein [Alphaproteobacteria bacterium]
MNRPVKAAAPKWTSADVGLYVAIGFFGLLPVALVCSLMLAQILRPWL